MKPLMTLAALAAALATPLAAGVAPADAAVSSASIGTGTATLNLDGADDTVTVSVSGGLLVHDELGAGLNSSADWDSSRPGDQTVPADGTSIVIVNGGDGNDAITVLARTTDIASATLNGEGGDDQLTGADTNDTLNGGDGDDRLIGAKGTDAMSGGNGNDTLIWNNGDGSDVMSGDAGNDEVQVNGSPTAGDAFTLAPDVGGGLLFKRTNLVPFALQASSERFDVNGLGGDDTFTGVAGIGALTQLTVDGGAGADTITGGDGDDRLIGSDGDDVVNGGAGDDTLVWDNGDGSDTMNGDDGRDDVEVNGSPTAGDVFTVAPSGSRIQFERTNLVPFSLDIGSSETMHANGLGGDDAITVGDVGAFAVTAAGGSGNDTLTGGSASGTFLGGSGNDTIDPGSGSDVVFGDDGDDLVNLRDNAPDIAFGGDGTDAVTADAAGTDLLDGFESVDRPPVVTPPAQPVQTPPVQAPPVLAPPVQTPPPVDTTTRPVTISGGTVKVTKGTATFTVGCPASSPGRCTGSLTVLSAGAVRIAGTSLVVQLGTARFDVEPGTTQAVKVRVASGVTRLADRHGHVKVALIAATGRSGAIASSSQRATLAVGVVASHRRV